MHLPGAVRPVLATALVLLGAGLIVYGVAGTRPEPMPDCRETILDPGPDQQDRAGSLHLLTCPGEKRTGYSIQLTDYWRTPPVSAWLLNGSVDHPGEPAVPVRGRWVTHDSLVLSYHPALRIQWIQETAGPVHVTFEPQP